MRTFDVLQNRAAGTRCTPCPTACIADQVAIRTFDVLHTRAAGAQCTQSPTAFNADQLAMRTFDVLQTRTAGPQCTQSPKAFTAGQLATSRPMITARLKQSPDTASAPWVPAKTKRPLAKTKTWLIWFSLATARFKTANNQDLTQTN